jgi:hypothetical protein
MRITELQQFILKSILSILKSCIQNSAVLPEWVGGGVEEGKTILYNTYIHTFHGSISVSYRQQDVDEVINRIDPWETPCFTAPQSEKKF